ncbi:MAG: hypothetical protein KDJ35_01730 [Alphaproteobacteria bacterium]|nr:hypothetical protein [Alphaproteobacteria bacterium]
MKGLFNGLAGLTTMGVGGLSLAETFASSGMIASLLPAWGTAAVIGIGLAVGGAITYSGFRTLVPAKG